MRIGCFLSIIGSLQLFDLVYIVWGQYVSTTAGMSTMATYMVREGRESGNYGYGSAVAVVVVRDFFGYCFVLSEVRVESRLGRCC